MNDINDEQLRQVANTWQLSKVEARVIACLMEKELTVPDTYPLSLNALTLACNQKSNREPMMQLNEGEVGHTAKTLKDRGLIGIEYGERVHRFEHKMRKVFHLDKRKQALLTVMMLRTPQTINDLKVRTKRMTDFEDNDDILRCLTSLNDKLDDAATLLMQHLPKGAGQREDRYTHLLCGEVAADIAPSNRAAPAFTPPASGEQNNQEIEALKSSLTELIKRVEALEANSA